MSTSTNQTMLEEYLTSNGWKPAEMFSLWVNDKEWYIKLYGPQPVGTAVAFRRQQKKDLERPRFLPAKNQKKFKERSPKKHGKVFDIRASGPDLVSRASGQVSSRVDGETTQRISVAGGQDLGEKKGGTTSSSDGDRNPQVL